MKVYLISRVHEGMDTLIQVCERLEVAKSYAPTTAEWWEIQGGTQWYSDNLGLEFLIDEWDVKNVAHVWGAVQAEKDVK